MTICANCGTSILRGDLSYINPRTGNPWCKDCVDLLMERAKDGGK